MYASSLQITQQRRHAEAIIDRIEQKDISDPNKGKQIFRDFRRHEHRHETEKRAGDEQKAVNPFWNVDRLESRALKYLEEHVLGLTRSSEEVPGYEIPWLYFDYLRTGDARSLGGVFYHNAMDVVAMAALLAHMNDMLQSPYEGKVQHGLDFVALGKLFEDLGHWDEAARLFERGLESQLNEADFGLAVKRLSILQKKRGDVSEAIRLWEAATEQGHLYAFIELAKHYEHKERDVKSALKWTKSALKRVEKVDLPVYMQIGRAHV